MRRGLDAGGCRTDQRERFAKRPGIYARRPEEGDSRRARSSETARGRRAALGLFRQKLPELGQQRNPPGVDLSHCLLDRQKRRPIDLGELLSLT